MSFVLGLSCRAFHVIPHTFLLLLSKSHAYLATFCEVSLSLSCWMNTSTGYQQRTTIPCRSAGVKYNSMTADLCVHCKNFWRAWYIRYQTRWIAKECVSLISSIWMQACLWRSLFFIHCTHSLLWAAPCASCISKNLQPWTTPFVKEQLPLSLASVSLASANQNIKPLWPGWSETNLPPINDMSACFWWTCLPWRLFGYSVQLYQMIFGTRTQHQS